MATKFFYSTYQFAAVRFFTGMGLFFYFVTRKPYAPDFSAYDGLILKLSTLGIPNLFTYLPSIGAAKLTLLALSFLSILLAFGVQRRVATIILACGYIFSIGGIPLLPEPFSGFTMSLFLLLLIAPQGEALKLIKPAPPFTWRLPQWQYWLVYGTVLLGLLMTIYQTGAYDAFSGRPRKFNFSASILLVFGALILLHISLLSRKVRPYTWIVFTLCSLFIWTYGISNALLLVALLTFLLPTDTRFPWQAKPTGQPVGTIFVDGECVVCDEFATVVLEEDIWKNFQIATIQGPTGQSELPEEFRKELSTVVLKIDGNLLTHSTAVLEVLKRLPGLWAFAVLDQILVPRSIRDNFYKTFAKYRYKVFGRKEVCSLPPAKDKERILD